MVHCEKCTNCEEEETTEYPHLYCEKLDTKLCDINPEYFKGECKWFEDIDYVNAWVNVRYNLESSDYCKKIREDDTVPAFVSAVCQKCIDKKCKFLDICVGLYEMDAEDKEVLEDEE